MPEKILITKNKNYFNHREVIDDIAKLAERIYFIIEKFEPSLGDYQYSNLIPIAICKYCHRTLAVSVFSGGTLIICPGCGRYFGVGTFTKSKLPVDFRSTFFEKKS